MLVGSDFGGKPPFGHLGIKHYVGIDNQMELLCTIEGKKL